MIKYRFASAEDDLTEISVLDFNECLLKPVSDIPFISIFITRGSYVRHQYNNQICDPIGTITSLMVTLEGAWFGYNQNNIMHWCDPDIIHKVTDTIMTLIENRKAKYPAHWHYWDKQTTDGSNNSSS